MLSGLLLAMCQQGKGAGMAVCVPCGITQCYLPPGRGDIPALTPVKPIWILLKHETVTGSDISCPICKSAPRCRQITTPAPHCSVFYKLDALPAARPTVSKHWRHMSKVKSFICRSCLNPVTSAGRKAGVDGIALLPRWHAECGWRCWCSCVGQNSNHAYVR